MELVRLKDDVGVFAVWQFKQQEYECAASERQKVLESARQLGRAALPEELNRTAQNSVPMWQRMTGLQAENAWRLKPHERRGALMRLARVVERMVRAEWKRVLEPKDERGDPFQDNEHEQKKSACKYARRTEQWDPVSELCFYLEIAQSKLSDLLRQANGLRARELSDCVRVEGLREKLRARMRGPARAWLQNQFMTMDYRKLARMPIAEGAAVVLKEYRASAGFLDRTKLAQEAGVETRGRLYRSVRICERMELEELERAVAAEVFEELLPDVWAGCELDREEIARVRVELGIGVPAVELRE